MHPVTTSPYKATTAVLGRRIVKHGAADNTVVQATATAEAFAGVAAPLGAAAGRICDVIESGFAPIDYGGPVARGDPLTSDAQGRAIKAVPAAGVHARCIGFARISGVIGDQGEATVAPFILTGAA